MNFFFFRSNFCVYVNRSWTTNDTRTNGGLPLVAIALRDCAAASGGAGGGGRAGVGLRRESRARWGVSERANPGHQRFLLAVSGISKTAVFDSSQRGAATIPPPDSISCLRRPSRGPGFFASGDRMQIRTCAHTRTRKHARICRAKTKAKWHEGRRGGRDGGRGEMACSGS